MSDLTDTFANWDRVHWANPWALALVVAAPAFLYLLRRFTHSRRPPLPTVSILSRVSFPRTLRLRLLWLPFALRLIALALLALAIARPQLGMGRVQTTTDAVAIQIVMDRSGSMVNELEMDGGHVSRLDVVKKVLREFLVGDQHSLTGRSADLIGLVTFARFAQTACPLVRDARAVADLADAAQPAMQQYEDGTAIGDALALAAARLNTAEQDLRSRTSSDPDSLRIKSKVIVLLTDGEQTAGDLAPADAAALAKDWGIKVHTIGIGAGADSIQLLRDPFGNQRRVRVPSSIDENQLRQVAESTGGKYFRAQDAQALRAIYEEIDRMEKSTIRTIEYTDFSEKFSPFALLSASLLALETLLAATFLRRNAP